MTKTTWFIRPPRLALALLSISWGISAGLGLDPMFGARPGITRAIGLFGAGSIAMIWALRLVEEQTLRDIFGSAYTDYQRRVRRWL